MADGTLHDPEFPRVSPAPGTVLLVTGNPGNTTINNMVDGVVNNVHVAAADGVVPAVTNSIGSMGGIQQIQQIQQMQQIQQIQHIGAGVKRTLDLSVPSDSLQGPTSKVYIKTVTPAGTVNAGAGTIRVSVAPTLTNSATRLQPSNVPISALRIVPSSAAGLVLGSPSRGGTSLVTFSSSAGSPVKTSMGGVRVATTPSKITVVPMATSHGTLSVGGSGTRVDGTQLTTNLGGRILTQAGHQFRTVSTGGIGSIVSGVHRTTTAVAGTTFISSLPRSSSTAVRVPFSQHGLVTTAGSGSVKFPPSQRLLLPATTAQLPPGTTFVAGTSAGAQSGSVGGSGGQVVLVPAEYLPKFQQVSTNSSGSFSSVKKEPQSYIPIQMSGTIDGRPVHTKAISASSGGRRSPVGTAHNNNGVSSVVEGGAASAAASQAPSARTRKPCNCTKSKCLKLYCDCFSNGEFCNNCNCTGCANNLEHEEERQRAIKLCLEKNSSAFRPKIGKGGMSDSRRHQKGCNCKRSGCQKNYCECYEAKISCGLMCKCSGCKNFEESSDRKNLMHLATAAEVQQQAVTKSKFTSQLRDLPPSSSYGGSVGGGGLAGGLLAASGSASGIGLQSLGGLRQGRGRGMGGAFASGNGEASGSAQTKAPFTNFTTKAITAIAQMMVVEAQDAENAGGPRAELNAQRAVLEAFGEGMKMYTAHMNAQESSSAGASRGSGTENHHQSNFSNH